MVRSILLVCLVAFSCIALVSGQAASASAPSAAQVKAPFVPAAPNTAKCAAAAGECQNQVNGSQQFCDLQAGDVLKAGLCGTSATVKCCVFSNKPSTKRTRGPSSAYRRGQTGQLKDVNDRHHAKNGKFQRETAKASNGQLFDRRTGQFKASPAKAASKPASPAKPTSNGAAEPLAPKPVSASNPVSAVNAPPATPTDKRTNGPSSAYRRGQTGQFKDANDRHHAKNGKFQKETAHASNGQLFDRRTGQFTAAANASPAKPSSNGAAEPLTPKPVTASAPVSAVNAPPATPTDKRTNGPSSAYRRGQTGQFKDVNDRHHAKNGKFQRETAHASNGQLFDRRTGQFKAANGSPAKQVNAPFVLAAPNTDACQAAGGECQTQANGSQQFCDLKAGDFFKPLLCGNSNAVKCCVFAKAANAPAASAPGPAAVGL